MNKLFKMVSLLLALCILFGIPFGCSAEEEVIDAELTCTITLGNWPPDTAPEAEYVGDKPEYDTGSIAGDGAGSGEGFV